ncbi:DUF6461 domain-containing protein [Nonomuraea pusilla]|uniref:Lsr2 protein n=1 Tax=Nonomuraea pusilla TaxID=46177 RepID=A0A1H7JJD0_9ACTN|nr:DUF6461 domain-containing protein [Nonomuraea pusilla]SEK73575.1 Lsr2 protein [Nonomuraea pusilla]
MTDLLSQFRWLEEHQGDEHDLLGDTFCVSFLHRLDPAEVLSCFEPVTPAETMSFKELCGRARAYFEDAADVRYVGVAQVGEWSVAIEPWGGQAVLMMNQLSRAGEVVSVGRNDYAEHRFEYAVDGTIITRFLSREPDRRWGSDPDRLNGLMRQVGMVLEPPQDEGMLDSWSARMAEDSVARAFALAAKMTGVALTLSTLSTLHFVSAVQSGGRRAMSRDKSAEIRQWAKAHGLPLSERSRIASIAVEQAEDPRDTP